MQKIRTIFLEGPNNWSVVTPVIGVVEFDAKKEELTAFNEVLSSTVALPDRYQTDLNNLLKSVQSQDLINRLGEMIGRLTEVLQLQAGATLPLLLRRTSAPNLNNHAIFNYQCTTLATSAVEEAMRMVDKLIQGERSALLQISESVIKVVNSCGDCVNANATRKCIGIGGLPPYSDRSANKSILAVTGTNGKTTTTRLLLAMLRAEGYRAGASITEGVLLGEFGKEARDIDSAFKIAATHLNPTDRCFANTSGSEKRAMRVIEHPNIDVAVVEIARGAILRTGLPFLSCRGAALLNVASDHLGVGGVNTLDEMCDLKSVLIESVEPSGFVVLNGDDKRVRVRGASLMCSVAFFTTNPEDPFIVQQYEQGHLVACTVDEMLLLRHKGRETQVARIADLPFCFDGKVPFMVENALATILMAHLFGVSIKNIKNTLENTKASTKDNPGRLNHFVSGNVTSLIDYAHNAHGLAALGKYVMGWAGHKVGVITLSVFSGQNVDEVANLTAEIFDELIVTADEEPHFDNALSVMRNIFLKKRGEGSVHIMRNEVAGIQKGLYGSVKGSLVVLLVKDISRATWFAESHERAALNN